VGKGRVFDEPVVACGVGATSKEGGLGVDDEGEDSGVWGEVQA